MPERPIVALDVGVLLRLAGLDVLDGDPVLFSPLQQRAADVFGAIIDSNGAGFASPFDV